MDRHLSYDRLLRESRARFADHPLVMETGCIRSPEDWRGAGYSTFLLAAYVSRAGGELISVDNNSVHCEFARRATREFGQVTIECTDSVEFLQQWRRRIDVLHLDSMDTYDEGHAEHCLAELQAATANLHDNSIVAIDDTDYRDKSWHGLGRLAVPWALEHGWGILYSGHQTLLWRK